MAEWQEKGAFAAKSHQILRKLFKRGLLAAFPAEKAWNETASSSMDFFNATRWKYEAKWVKGQGFGSFTVGMECWKRIAAGVLSAKEERQLLI